MLLLAEGRSPTPQKVDLPDVTSPAASGPHGLTGVQSACTFPGNFDIQIRAPARCIVGGSAIPLAHTTMPDVGLFTAPEPVSPATPVVIKFSVEVGGLTVFQESYDVDLLRHELDLAPDRTLAFWARRLKCVASARGRPGFSAAVTRCLVDGHCCDHGTDPEGGDKLDDLGVASPPEGSEVSG
jgi:hypothetical protein